MSEVARQQSSAGRHKYRISIDGARVGLLTARAPIQGQTPASDLANHHVRVQDSDLCPLFLDPKSARPSSWARRHRRISISIRDGPWPGGVTPPSSGTLAWSCGGIAWRPSSPGCLGGDRVVGESEHRLSGSRVRRRGGWSFLIGAALTSGVGPTMRIPVLFLATDSLGSQGLRSGRCRAPTSRRSFPPRRLSNGPSPSAGAAGRHRSGCLVAGIGVIASASAFVPLVLVAAAASTPWSVGRPQDPFAEVDDPRLLPRS